MRKLLNLEYADDVTLLDEDPRKFLTFLDCPDESVGVFGMRFAPSK